MTRLLWFSFILKLFLFLDDVSDDDSLGDLPSKVPRQNR